MTAWHCYLQGWKGYVDFKGRATRKEFWTFIGVNYLLLFVLAFAVAYFFSLTDNSSVSFYYTMTQTIFSLVLILPVLAVGIRRMHDINRSGWWFGSVYISSIIARLLNNILLHYASEAVYGYSQLLIGIVLGWIPLIMVIYLCCKKSQANSEVTTEPTPAV